MLNPLIKVHILDERGEPVRSHERTRAHHQLAGHRVVVGVVALGVLDMEYWFPGGDEAFIEKTVFLLHALLVHSKLDVGHDGGEEVRRVLETECHPTAVGLGN